MAVYTTTLFELASTMISGSIKDRSMAIQAWLFNEDCGLNNDLKSTFEPSFIQHYLFTEIGYETPDLFRNRVQALLYGKSNYYNELWKLNNILTAWDLMEDDIDLRKDDNIHATTQDTQDNTHNRDIGEKEAYGESEEEKTESADYRSQESETTGNNTQNINNDQTDTNQNSGTIEDKGNQNTVEQGSGNSANSNFPQGNIAPGRDYYSDGNINNNQRTSDTDTGNLRTLNDGNRRTSTSDTNNIEKINQLLVGRQSQGNSAERMRESARDRSRQFEEMLKELVNKAIQEERQMNSVSRGRSQRRQVPEVVQMLREGYINVPMIMIKDQSENFMSIW